MTRRFGRYLPSKNSVQITRVCPCLIPLEHPSLTPLAEREKKLATLATVLGSLYTATAAGFLFGVFAAITVRRLLTALGPS